MQSPRIPTHWEIRRLKFSATICNGRDQKEVLDEEGSYYVFGSGGIFGKATKFLYDKPSVLLGRKGTINKPLFVKKTFWTVDTMFYTQIEEEVNPKYFYYLCLTIPFDYHRDQTTLPSMTQSGLANVRFPLAPPSEQKPIAEFLDWKTGQIDALIAKKKQLIEKLQEQRIAVITQAVTKGLNPNAPMRDSGIPWLGEVPEHWEIKRLRYLGATKNGVSEGAEYFGSGDPFISYGDVYKNEKLPSSVTGLAKSTPQDQQIFSVEEGDVLFTRTSETAEEIGISSTCFETVERSVFAGFLIRFRPEPKSGLTKEYSRYYFRSSIHRSFFNKEMNLVTRVSLGQELLRKLPVLLPPREEQKEIAKFLDGRTEKIDSLSTKVRAAIDRLTEYRTALITAATTGKIDVRNVQIPPPRNHA